MKKKLGSFSMENLQEKYITKLQEYKNYYLLITGGQDKQGFCMTNKIKDIERKKFKISLGTPGFRKRYRRVGSFKYKTLRGSMITPEIAVINCVIFPKS